MYYFINYIACFTLLCSLSLVRCLVQLPSVEHDDMAITETVIRETVNSLFATFRIRDVGLKPRLKDFSIIHNSFVSITLKDCKNLRRILQLIQVQNLDNNTLHIIAQINEVLNESDKSTEAIDDINLNMLIEKFITKLRDLKKSYTFKSNFANYSINAKILEHLSRPGDFFYNISNVHLKQDNVLNSNEIWKPTERSGRRIFQGHRTRIKHYPFMASVHFFGKFQCAGSIIHKDLVITAASCLQLAWNNRFFRENPAFLSVQIGSDYYEAGGEVIPVLEVYFHPEYTPKTLHNNLAIMRLNRQIAFSKRNKHVRRIETDQSASPLPINTDGIIIVGWGAKDHTNILYDPWINKISFTELECYPLAECQEVYSKEFVTRKHFCAGYFTKGSGACQHDIGGPGVSSGILVGVISFGSPTCGTPDAPTVFTKVGYYKDWIDSVINMPVPIIALLSTLRDPKVTLSAHYSDRTRGTYKMTPVPEQAREHTTDTYIHKIFPKDTLRILEDDKLFKEFLATMFSNENKDDGHVNKYNKEKTKTNFVSKPKTKLSTSINTPSPIFSDTEDNDYDAIESTEMRAKDNYRKITKTKTTATPLPTLYDSEYNATHLNRIKGKKTLILTTSTRSTLFDETAYEGKDTEDYEAEMKANDFTTKKVRKRIEVNQKNSKKHNLKLKKHITKLKRSKTKTAPPVTAGFLQLLDDNLEDLDIEELIAEIKGVEENTNSKKNNENVVSSSNNTDNSKLETKLKSKSTISTTSNRRSTDEDVSVDYNDNNGDNDEYLSKAIDNAKTIEHKDNSKTSNSDEAVNESDGSTLEEDIKDLLDELDLRKLLESEEITRDYVEKNGNESKQGQEKIQQDNVSKAKKNIKKHKIKDSSLASYSSNDDNREVSRESGTDR